MAVKRELKLKARLLSPKEVGPQLRKLAKKTGKESCKDYFFENRILSENCDFRLRKDEKGKTVLFKMQESFDIVQDNVEFKFQAEEAEDFVKFLEKMGFTPISSLKKTSEVYQTGAIAIRISEVEFLGHFVEITTEVVDDSVEELKEAMLGILDKLKVERSAIEKRYYNQIKEKYESTLSQE